MASDIGELHLVTVGTPNGLSGPEIVDMIMDGKKKVKYMSILRGSLGKWIALRQSYCEKEKKGLVRCAIKLHWAALDDPQWRRVEWGWEPGKDRAVYAITEVAVFHEPVGHSCAHQGLPCRLKPSDETNAVAKAILESRRFKNEFPSEQLRCPAPVKTKRRLEAKNVRAARRAEVVWFPSDRLGCSSVFVIFFSCCRRGCVTVYGVQPPVDNADKRARVENAELLAWARETFHAQSHADMRKFMGPRVKDVGAVERACFLESLQELLRYKRDGHGLPFNPEQVTGLVHVCKMFWVWVWGISNNKLYQPTMASITFQVYTFVCFLLN